MNSTTAVQNFNGSVGWLIDRTGIYGDILGSAWLISEHLAVTSAHLLIPFFEAPQALSVKLPLAGSPNGKVFGVQEIKVHNGYDPWLAKRNFADVQLFPALDMANQAFNLAALTLSDSPAPMIRSVIEDRILSRAMPSSDSALSGKATRLQITSIIQTLLNAHNQGTLTLYTRTLPVARFFIKDMKISHIQYRNFINEEALFNLITGDDEEYRFFFVQEYAPEWTNFNPIDKSTAYLLMNAYTRLEESSKMIEELGGPSALAQQGREELNLDGIATDDQPAAACIWNHIRFPISIIRLTKVCRFDSSIVMRALHNLHGSGQVRIEQPQQPEICSPTELIPANVVDLERGNEIRSLGIDPLTNQPVEEFGYILDPLEDMGQGYYAHSIGLPMSAVGSPLVRGSDVVGIHCGLLVRGAEPYKDWFHPGLLISAEAIYQCIDFGHGISTSEILTFRSAAQDQRRARGIHSFSESNYMGTSSQYNMNAVTAEQTIPPQPNTSQTGMEAQSYDPGQGQDSTLPEKTDYIVSKAKTKSGFFDVIKGMFGGKATHANDTLELALLRQGLDSDRFERVLPDKGLQKGDVVRMRLKSLAQNYLVVLFKAQGDSTTRLIYPESTSQEEPFLRGGSIEVPTQFTDSRGAVRKKLYAGIPINSTEGEVDVLLIITKAEPVLVKLFEQGIDDMFNAFSDQLVTGKAFVSGKFILERGKPTRVMSTAPNTNELFNVCRIELRHG